MEEKKMKKGFVSALLATAMAVGMAAAPVSVSATTTTDSLSDVDAIVQAMEETVSGNTYSNLFNQGWVVNDGEGGFYCSDINGYFVH